MAKAEFVRNVTTARNLFFHRVQTNHAALDPQTLQAQLERATIWLTPSSMHGFDVRDFQELSPEDRRRLQENVERFTQIAKQVPPTKPATAVQVQEAMDAFLKLLDILQPYLAAGSEAEQIRESLEGIRFPEGVLTWEYELGDDSTGDPAVWVWVFVNDDTAIREDFPALTRQVRQKIRDAFLASGINRWPYIRFRTASEQRAL